MLRVFAIRLAALLACPALVRAQAGSATTESPLPSLPAALREQFGLELKSETGPVELLVIDRAERPTPN